MADAKILLVVADAQLGNFLGDGILKPAGYQVTLVKERESAEDVYKKQEVDVAIIEVGANYENDLSFTEQLLGDDPACSVILVNISDNKDLLYRAFRVGISDFLVLPVEPGTVLDAVQFGLQRRRKFQLWLQNRIQTDNISLRHYVDELKELENIGRSVTASLDLDHVLTVIVDAAVKLTGAEEGSLLILDDESGELLMRASRNFQDEFVRTFRLPVNDTLAGEVIRKGVPVMINEDTPQKIKTRYLVRALLYIPLQVNGKMIGVLGVDNRGSGQGFTQNHLSLVSTLADYAAIAVENARLYHDTEVERHKLNSILTQIEDGVIVIGTDNRVVMVNPTARLLFDLVDKDITGKPLDDVFQHEGLIDIFTSNNNEIPYRGEIELEDGYILNTQLVKIPDVGLAVTIQDITYYKELDRIKTEFVNTVSHDLRSPLTAILGYVELIGRIGEVNDQQREFIKRVQISVRNITELINDLLELGRIEAGFDTRKEYVPMSAIVQFAVDGIQNQLESRKHKLSVEIEENIPDAFGDPIRLRQVVDNLLTNAMRYTPDGGYVSVRLSSQRDQVILQVEDGGIGIPYPDQPYIFDRFYRANNVPGNVSGSGLGLAIVKSIVESHQGRVWVDSKPGEGSRFTVVLPIPD